MKSSSAFEGLDPNKAGFGLAGLAFGDGATLGIVPLDGLGWLEWLVFGLATGFFGGLILLTLGVLAFAALIVDGLMLDSLLLGPWAGLLTEYGPAVAGLAISGRLNFAPGLIGATESPP